TSGSTASALSPSYLSAAGSWSQGQANVVLTSAAKNFCWLTRVTGHFVGTGEVVRVFIDANNNWEIGGASAQQGVAGSADCIPYSKFIPEAGGVAGPSWTAEASVFTGPCPNCGGSGAFGVGASRNLWQGDAAIMLSGMTGQFLGGGESIDVQQAHAPSLNWLDAGAFSPNGVGAWGRVLFIGVPGSDFRPLFFQDVNGPYSLSTIPFEGLATATMIPTSEGFCYFVNIGGAFAGGGELVQITTVMMGGVQHWSLGVQTQQSNGTSAQARCYAFNQSVSQ
ncbi:MAG: hypothetical protein WBY94_15590, partial [Polyangiaceae bacterium]